jgi:uncharacterized protein YcfL
MKKVFAILAVAGFMAACNSSTDVKVSTEDSIRIADSASKAAMDTAKAAMDTAKAAMDTAKKM